MKLGSLITYYCAKARTLWSNFRLLLARLRGRRIVLFYTPDARSFPFVEPIWQRLTNEKTLQCFLVVKQIYAEHAITYLESRGVRRSEWLVVSSAYSLKIADIFISAFVESLPDCRCERIQVFHGLAGWGCAKGADPEMKSLRAFNRLFLTGPNQEQIIQQQYFARYPEAPQDTKLHKIGYVKTDALFERQDHRSHVVRRYSLKANVPIILYAPTWEKEASLFTAGEEILAALATLPANILFKPHPMFFYKAWHRSDAKPWEDVFHTLEITYPNLRIIREADSNPFVVAADLLVTDVSGIGFEYLLLDKPIIYFDCPAFFATYGSKGIEYWGRSAGVVVSTPEELVQAAQQALKKPTQLHAQRQQVVNRLVYNPGHAADMAVAAVKEILNCEIQS